MSIRQDDGEGSVDTGTINRCATEEDVVVVGMEDNVGVANEESHNSGSSSQNHNDDDDDDDDDYGVVITLDSRSDESYANFQKQFFQSRGMKILLIVITLHAIAIGCTVAVIPHIILDRYAQMEGYYYPNDNNSQQKQQRCSQITNNNSKQQMIIPKECKIATEYAQNAVANSDFIYNILLLIGNPIMGTYSDTNGRRYVLLLCLFGTIIPAITLCITTYNQSIHPIWYYISRSIIGIVGNPISIIFASISDNYSSNSNNNNNQFFRSNAFGLILAVYFGGIHLSPMLDIIINENTTTIVSFLLFLASFLLALIAFPETLVESSSTTTTTNTERISILTQHDDESTTIRDQTDNSMISLRELSSRSVLKMLLKPLHDMTILNDNLYLRLITIANFLCSMVLATDTTILIYYLENVLHLSIRDFNAGALLLMTMWGITLQGRLLQPLSNIFYGQEGLLLVTFLCGMIQNVLYGLARGKQVVFMALMISQVTKLCVPLISSLAAKHVKNTGHNGQLQGSLFGITALAQAIGPLFFELIYHYTHQSSFFFFVAAGFFLLGAIIIFLLPKSTTNNERDDSLQEPLLNNEVTDAVDSH